MSYVLDTSVLIEIRKGNNAVAEAIKKLVQNDEDAYITLMTYSEYYYGCIDLRQDAQNDCLNFLNSFGHITLTRSGAKQYAELTRSYEKKGIALDMADMFIAVISIDHKMTLITCDRAFSRIKELKVELVPA
jgi:predicted nucleic acid-binding protein